MSLNLATSLKRSLTGAMVAAALFAPAMAAENRFGVAVIIGNASYSHERVPDVVYAHRDAEAFKRYVIDVLGFREGNIIDLRDASQAQMVAAFGNESDFKGKVYDWVRAGRSDVVVFYSGHGVPGSGSDRRGYLLPGDAEPSKARLNGYPIDVLYKNLAQIEAKSVTVFIDACFSGDTPRGMLIQSASPVFVEASLPEAANGLTVLTASSGAQLASWDEDRRHGLFTSYVLEGLYGAADGQDFGDGDGQVTLSELQGWLDSEMTYHARRQFSRDQHATVQGDGAAVLNAVPETADWHVASIAPAPSVTVPSADEPPADAQSAALGDVPEATKKPGIEVMSLGITISDIPDDVANRPGFEDVENGVLVTSVDPDSDAWTQQIREGAVIVEANMSEVFSPADVERAVQSARDDGSMKVVLMIATEDGLDFVAVELR